MRLIGIVRVSTDQQAGANGEGLERQRNALRQIETALRKDYPDLTVLEPVEVRGVSGSDLADTPEWKNRIVPALKAGTHLMADSIDRVVRASHFDMRTMEALSAAKGSLYIPGRKFDTTDSRDRMILSMFAAIGGFEKAEIARRAVAGREEKRKRGEWVGRLDSTPLGTVYSRQTKRWTYDEERAAAVRQAFVSYGAGASLAEAASILGVTAPGARIILTNAIYRGLLRFDKKRGEKYASVDGRQAARRVVPREPDECFDVRVYGGEGQEKQLVPDDLWNTVASRVAATNAEGRRRREKTAPSIYLSGLMFSSHEWDDVAEYDLTAVPKHVVYGESGGDDRPTRYACKCRRDVRTDPNAPRPRCALHYQRAEWLNRGVDAYLVGLTTETWGYEEVREQLRQREDGHGVERERKRLEGVLAGLRKQEARLTDLLLEDRVTKEDHDQRQDEIRTKRDAATRQLAGLAKPVEVDLDAVGRAWTYDASWSPEAKRAWLLKWTKGVVISNSGVESVTLRLPAQDGSSVMFTGGGARTWLALTGVEFSRVEGRLMAEGRLTAGEVVRRLGWEPGTKSTNRLGHLVRSGRIPAPQGSWGMKRTWSEAEFEVLKAALG